MFLVFCLVFVCVWDWYMSVVVRLWCFGCWWFWVRWWVGWFWFCLGFLVCFFGGWDVCLMWSIICVVWWFLVWGWCWDGRDCVGDSVRCLICFWSCLWWLVLFLVVVFWWLCWWCGLYCEWSVLFFFFVGWWFWWFLVWFVWEFVVGMVFWWCVFLMCYDGW